VCEREKEKGEKESFKPGASTARILKLLGFFFENFCAPSIYAPNFLLKSLLKLIHAMFFLG